MAVFSAASSIITGNRAADAQEEASERSTDVQREIFYQNRTDLAPQRVAGQNALAAQSFELGLGPRPFFSANGLNSFDEDGNIDPILYSARGGNASGRSGSGGSRSGPIQSLYQQNNPAQSPEYLRNRVVYQPNGEIDRENSTFSPPGNSDLATPFGRGPSTFSPQPRQTAQQDSGRGSGQPATAYGGFTATPGYQFRVSEGQSAVDNRLAGQGLGNSGAALKATERFRQGIAADEYGTYYNRLGALSGQGQVATNNLANLGQNFAAAAGNNYLQAGNARAANFNNIGSSINQGIGNIQQAAGFFL